MVDPCSKLIRVKSRLDPLFAQSRLDPLLTPGASISADQTSIMAGETALLSWRKGAVPPLPASHAKHTLILAHNITAIT